MPTCPVLGGPSPPPYSIPVGVPSVPLPRLLSLAGQGGAGAVFSVLRLVHLLFTLLAWPKVSCSIKPLGQFQVSLIPPFADTCLRL